MKKIKGFSSLFLCLTLVLSLNIGLMPAQAASSSEFDRSANDSLDKYDQYAKKVSDDGITYVDAAAHNSIDTSKPGIDEIYRYGAYLRSTSEEQYYSFLNLQYTSGSKSMSKNTLTIYADPEVKFSLTDYSGVTIADSTGKYMSSKVSYFKVSTDAGHTVYFLELVPQPNEAGKQMVRFSTDSTTTQPHYSFWFGNPLYRTGTKAGNSFAVSISAPNRASTTVNVYNSGMPTRSWVSKVTVKPSYVGDANLMRASVELVMPGPDPIASSRQDYRTTPAVFNDNTNSAIAHPANGTYKISLVSVSWKTGVKPGASFLYQGSMTIDYIYAFGA